jgi:hypothetical protein
VILNKKQIPDINQLFSCFFIFLSLLYKQSNFEMAESLFAFFLFSSSPSLSIKPTPLLRTLTLILWSAAHSRMENKASVDCV